MKKILILSRAMEVGGIERSIVGMLSSIDASSYQVDLFLSRHEGELMKFIPNTVNLLPLNKAQYLAIPMKKLVQKHQWKMLYGRLKAKILAKRTVHKQNLDQALSQVEDTYAYKYTYKYIEQINPDTEYDLVISFHTPHYLGINNCRAKKKIAWIHSDYSTISIDVEEELAMYEEYDYIASISDECTNAFLQKMPSLAPKIVRIDNIITKDMIKDQAAEFIPSEYDNASLKLCSVGRFCYQKNFHNVPEICSYLVQKGLDIKWYLIGYGGDEQLIKDKIIEWQMQDHVIVLGKKENPYPYIKNCDIYIQPSNFEGKAVTVREAQILCKPVIITDYPTAKSQVNDGIDGVIIPLENKKCANELANIIQNKNLLKKIHIFLYNTDYSNQSEIIKVYNLI